MTTNQTIDGVPLLPCPFCGGEPYGTHDHYVHDDLSPMHCVECWSCSAHLKAKDWNRRVHPAAQPQGEPVALEVVGRQCFPSDAMKAVQGYRKEPWVDDCVGKTPSEPGFYRVEPLVRLSDVAKLYAEQPAPVAVVLPKLEMAHVVRAHMEIPGCPVLTSNQCYALAMKLNACLDEVTRLNTKE